MAYGEFIARNESAETLFYLDPPYFGTEDFNGAGAFDRADFGRLARQLGTIAGSFILTVNDASETRAIFAAFDQEQVGVTYTAASRPSPQASRRI